MAVQEIIKYEGDNETLISKYPKEDFNTLSQLIVHESQEAVFFSDGKALDTFKAGRHTLETKNIPLLSKLRNLVSGGVSPFHVEVYFINLVTMLDIPWGTPSMVTVKDPVYSYNYSAGAHGSFGLEIIDGRKLLIKLVGTETLMSRSHVQKYFKDLIVAQVKSQIAVELSRYSYNEINQRLVDISASLDEIISSKLSSYGIKTLNFIVSAVGIDPVDLDELKSLDNSMTQKRFKALGDRDAKIILAEGEAQSRAIQGYTWQQEQQFGVNKAFAENEGFAANPANMMAQIPIAFSMGNIMKDSIETGAATASPAAISGAPNNGQNTGRIICPQCKAQLMPDSKFCHECGTKIEMQQKRFCTECGKEIISGQRFCRYCGQPVSEVEL